MIKKLMALLGSENRETRNSLIVFFGLINPATTFLSYLIAHNIIKSIYPAWYQFGHVVFTFLLWVFFSILMYIISVYIKWKIVKRYYDISTPTFLKKLFSSQLLYIPFGIIWGIFWITIFGVSFSVVGTDPSTGAAVGFILLTGASLVLIIQFFGIYCVFISSVIHFFLMKKEIGLQIINLENRNIVSKKWFLIATIFLVCNMVLPQTFEAFINNILDSVDAKNLQEERIGEEKTSIPYQGFLGTTKESILNGFVRDINTAKDLEQGIYVPNTRLSDLIFMGNNVSFSNTDGLSRKESDETWGY